MGTLRGLSSKMWLKLCIQTFLRYMLRLIDPIYSKLGFDPKPSDTNVDILLRTLAVSIKTLLR